MLLTSGRRDIAWFAPLRLAKGKDEPPQMVNQLPGDAKIRRFESFCEPVIDRSEGVAGLVALSVLGQQAGQGRRRSQLPGQRRLLSRHGERLHQAVRG